MNKKFNYLIYDIESVIDKALLNKVLFPGENLSDEEAYQKHIEELAKDDRTFVNPAFHQPISLAAMAVRDDFSIEKIGLLGGDDRTTFNIVNAFWNVYNEKRPILVDFNGRGYDVRLLELWAFRLGLTIDKRHFAKFGTRYRFSDDHHIDLHDFLTNHGAVRFQGGLNLFSKLLGKPGKMSTKGEMVQELFEADKNFEIDDYCLCDTMDTYFVFLRTRVLVGELSLTQEQELVSQAKQLITRKSEEEGYFKSYLENFGQWQASA